MKILITGFEAFGDDEVNPSMEAIKNLPSAIEGCVIETAVLPVCFGGGSEKLTGMLEKNSFDAVICTGLAGGRTAITPEVLAVNLMHARIPDNAGHQPEWEKILPDGEDGLFSTLPVRKMVERLKEEDLPAEISFSAGTFVCNEVMYRLLAFLRETSGEIPAGFIHVPYASEYIKKGKSVFSMPIDQITRGLELCIQVLIEEIGVRKTERTAG